MTRRSAAPVTKTPRTPRPKPAAPVAPPPPSDGRTRCGWVGADALYLAYHDEEWGLPLHDDRALFELLILEGAQAGLSWITVLRKRARYREVFDNFEPARVARFDARRLERLLADPGIVRNAAKLRAAVQNAQACLRVIEEQGSFDRYLWSFVGGRPRTNHFAALSEVPASTPESEAMSRDLRRRGFNFVGPTICYAFMQAAGLVNDHLVGCFRHRQVSARNAGRSS
jgi:DNA-3-methyladenine glycosylase I